jgi:dolichyl-phosphate beta-glucosyltransferase
MTSLSIVIPAFNEEQRLGITLRSIYQHQKNLEIAGLSIVQVIVSDDGSIDRTIEVAESFQDVLPIVIVRLGYNKGKGAAVRKGMEQSIGDLSLMYDADGATPITEVPKLYRALFQENADIAIGSRVMNQFTSLVSMSWHRKFIGRIYHFFCSALVPSLQDTACGCKLYRKETASFLFRIQHINRFAFDVEVLALAIMYSKKIVEVPVAWTAVPESKVRIVRDGLQMLLCVIGLYIQKNRSFKNVNSQLKRK